MKRFTFIILGTLFFNLLGCNDDGNDNNSNNVTSANISGSLNLYDDGTTQLDNSGMTITAEGTSPLITAVTDTNGNFTLTDVPFGTYTIAYEKSGYGTYKLFNLAHSNTGSSTIILNSPSLGQASTTEVTNLTTTVTDSVIILASTNPASNIANPKYLRFFYHTSSDVSNTNYTEYSEGLIAQINPYQLILTPADLSSLGFASGTTVYVKAYGDSFWSNAYDDPATGKRVFPNLNTTSATAVSFVVP